MPKHMFYNTISHLNYKSLKFNLLLKKNNKKNAYLKFVL